MKFIYLKKSKFRRIWSLIVLGLVISGCGSKLSQECDYYKKLREGKAKNTIIKGNQSIKSLQGKIIACGFNNKSCRDMVLKEFRETHNCSQ